MSKQHKVPYNKPALLYQAQLQKLQARGLFVEDEVKALHLLEHISYYRLSGYWYPLLANPKHQHRFLPSASFDLAFNLYCFDRNLRKLVLAELEKIEVGVRAKLIYSMAHQYGPFWFQNSALFRNSHHHSKSLKRLQEECQRSDEQFIKAFEQKYSDPLPPSWIIMEVTSFGMLSKLFQNLRPGRPKRQVAQHFGLDENTFGSWLHTIVYIRNLCAHHSRLWNRVMSISPVIPQKPRKQWLQLPANNTKLYFLLSMMLYLLETVNPHHTFRKKILSFLEEFPDVDTHLPEISLSAMGFSAGWQQEKL